MDVTDQRRRGAYRRFHLRLLDPPELRLPLRLVEALMHSEAATERALEQLERADPAEAQRCRRILGRDQP